MLLKYFSPATMANLHRWFHLLCLILTSSQHCVDICSVCLIGTSLC